MKIYLREGDLQMKKGPKNQQSAPFRKRLFFQAYEVREKSGPETVVYVDNHNIGGTTVEHGKKGCHAAEVCTVAYGSGNGNNRP